MGSKENNTRTGDLGESIAAEFLGSHGFTIEGKKVRTSWCEIDLLARRGDVLHIVEVKSTTALYESGYRPEELVHAHKLHKLRSYAEWYLNAHTHEECCISVVAVWLDMRTRRARCRLIEGV